MGTTKIASPQDLQKELITLLAHAEGVNPSREKLASAMRDLASRVAAKGLEPWLEHTLSPGYQAEKDFLKPYRTLADAANVTGNDDYGKPGATIWYWKPEFSRDLLMGYDWVVEHNPELLEQTARQMPRRTHKTIGRVGTRNLGEIYKMMQGEIWSPNGQARKMIGRVGLDHTSMSVGDIIQIGSQYHFVDRVGFERL
jgi:hypothetical protein